MDKCLGVILRFGRQNDRIRFLALHGLRFGEAAALTAEDIYDGKVHITKSKYGPTKSASGVRTVPYMGHFVPFPKFQLTIAEKLKPFGVTVHSLRKTYAYCAQECKCAHHHCIKAHGAFQPNDYHEDLHSSTR